MVHVVSVNVLLVCRPRKVHNLFDFDCGQIAMACRLRMRFWKVNNLLGIRGVLVSISASGKTKVKPCSNVDGLASHTLLKMSDAILQDGDKLAAA